MNKSEVFVVLALFLMACVAGYLGGFTDGREWMKIEAVQNGNGVMVEQRVGNRIYGTFHWVIHE